MADSSNNLAHVLIPTCLDKKRWLDRTLFGLRAQTNVELDIRVMIDAKPWDDKRNIAYEFRALTPPARNKRQHEILNMLALESANDGAPLLLMDDDYWLQSVHCIERMLAGMQAHGDQFVLVCPTIVKHLPMSAMPNTPVETCAIKPNGDIDYGIMDMEHGVVNLNTAGDDGHNPMAGHPKLIRRRDFVASGGFDVQAFKHYWWCDTDMWERIKMDCTLVQSGTYSPIHIKHPKYQPEMFMQENTETFLERHETTADSDLIRIAHAVRRK